MAAVSQIIPRLDDTAQRLLWKIASFLYALLGLSGTVRVSDTATYSGTYWGYHAITTSVIGSIAYAPGFSGGAQAGDTLVAGDRISGLITSFSLTSGTGELVQSNLI